MTREDESPYLGGRVAGAVVVAAGTYGVLWYWDTWGLSQEVRHFSASGTASDALGIE
jgi:hypothetical protein